MVLKDVHKLRKDVDELMLQGEEIVIDELVSEVDVFYIQTNSRTEKPPLDDPFWSTTTPPYQEGKFVWSKTVSYNKDGEILNQSDPVCITGYKGKGLTEIKEKYAIGSNNYTPPTGTWVENPPSLTDDKPYLWNYEIIYYDDGTEESTPKKVIGYKGKDGQGGTGISEVINYYALSSNPNVEPTNWSTEPPQMTPTMKYLWNYEKVVYTSGSEVQTEACIIGVYGDKGQTGEKGEKGQDGVDGVDGTDGGGIDESGIPIPNTSQYVHIRFANVNSIQSLEQLHMLPQGRIWVYKPLTNTSAPPTTISAWGTGVAYEIGKGVAIGNTGKYIHLKYAYNANGVGMNDYGGSYMGYYINTTQSDKTDPQPSDYTWRMVKGKSILQIVEEYAQINSYTTAPIEDDWTTERPTAVKGKYIWTRSVIIYTDGSEDKTNGICVLGQDGMDGDGVKYVYKRTFENTTPQTPTAQTEIHTGKDEDDTGATNGYWYDDPQGTKGTVPFEWISKREYKLNPDTGEMEWGSYSTPSLWDWYVSDGIDGSDGLKGDDGQDGKDGLGFTEETLDSVNQMLSGVINANTINGTPASDFVTNEVSYLMKPATSLTGQTIYGTDGKMHFYRMGNLVIVIAEQFKIWNGFVPTTEGWKETNPFIPEEFRPDDSSRSWGQCDFNTLRWRINDGGKLSINCDVHTGQTVGEYNFRAVYFTKPPKKQLTLTMSKPNPFYYGDGIEYTVKEGNTGLENIAVSNKINGVTYNRLTNSNGVATQNIRLAPAKYTISAVHTVPTLEYESSSINDFEIEVKMLPSTHISHERIEEGCDSFQQWIRFYGEDDNGNKFRLANVNVQLVPFDQYNNGKIVSGVTDGNGNIWFDISNMVMNLQYKVRVLATKYTEYKSFDDEYSQNTGRSTYETQTVIMTSFEDKYELRSAYKQDAKPYINTSLTKENVHSKNDGKNAYTAEMGLNKFPDGIRLDFAKNMIPTGAKIDMVRVDCTYGHFGNNTGTTSEFDKWEFSIYTGTGADAPPTLYGKKLDASNYNMFDNSVMAWYTWNKTWGDDDELHLEINTTKNKKDKQSYIAVDWIKVTVTYTK